MRSDLGGHEERGTKSWASYAPEDDDGGAVLVLLFWLRFSPWRRRRAATTRAARLHRRSALLEVLLGDPMSTSSVGDGCPRGVDDPLVGALAELLER